MSLSWPDVIYDSAHLLPLDFPLHVGQLIHVSALDAEATLFTALSYLFAVANGAKNDLLSPGLRRTFNRLMSDMNY